MTNEKYIYMVIDDYNYYDNMAFYNKKDAIQYAVKIFKSIKENPDGRYIDETNMKYMKQYFHDNKNIDGLTSTSASSLNDIRILYVQIK